VALTTTITAPGMCTLLRDCSIDCRFGQLLFTLMIKKAAMNTNENIMVWFCRIDEALFE
jgi:hypothetical protein